MKKLKKIAQIALCVALCNTLTNCGSDSNEDTATSIVGENPPKNDQEEIAEGLTENIPENDVVTITPQVVQANGTIIVQAEDTNLVADWKERTSATGFNGDGYIVWEGPEKFWDKGTAGQNGLLTYKITVDEPGTYQFIWTSRIVKGEPASIATEHNDSWVRLPDADDFYAFDDVNNDKYYATGNAANKTPVIPIDFLNPNPNNLPKGGENRNGFFKGYMNTYGSWLQKTNTWDNNPMLIFATFNTAGVYTVEIDARSDGHAIDQFSLIPQKEE